MPDTRLIWRWIALALCLAFQAPAPVMAQETRLEEVFRSGVADARKSNEVEFYRISDLAAGPDSVVYVAEQSGSIVRLSCDGRVLDQFGGSGGGPGEFRHLANLGWRGDTLVALEAMLPRVTLFPPGARPETFVFRPDLFGTGRPAVPRGMLLTGEILSVPVPDQNDWASGMITESPIIRLQERRSIPSTPTSFPRQPTSGSMPRTPERR